MSRVDLSAIRKRAEQATPGPWEAKYHHLWRVVTPDNDVAYDCDVDVYSATNPDGTIMRQADNAEFIAASRTDVPALCDEVEALRTQVAEQGIEFGKIRVINEGLIVGCMEVDRLRKRLDAAKELLREEYRRCFEADVAHHDWAKRIGKFLEGEAE